jgi:hypothetical protein
MASYLEPRPTDEEVIEAIRYHFPSSAQQAMLSTQLRSVGEALDLLKRIEMLEASEGGNRPTSSLKDPTQRGRTQIHKGMTGADHKAKYVTYSITLIPGITSTESKDETVTTVKGILNPGV